jgi:hypothetical protein
VVSTENLSGASGAGWEVEGRSGREEGSYQCALGGTTKGVEWGGCLLGGFSGGGGAGLGGPRVSSVDGSFLAFVAGLASNFMIRSCFGFG